MSTTSRSTELQTLQERYDNEYNLELIRIDGEETKALTRIDEEERLKKEQIDEDTAREVRRLQEDATLKKERVQKEAQKERERLKQTSKQLEDSVTAAYDRTIKLLELVGSSLKTAPSSAHAPLHGAQWATGGQSPLKVIKSEPPEPEEETSKPPGEAFTTLYLNCTELQFKDCQNLRFTEEELVKHLETVHNLLRYRCLVRNCRASYGNRSELQTHEKKHTEPLYCRQFGCDHNVSKSVQSFIQLRQHFRKFHKTGSFVCLHFGKSSDSASERCQETFTNIKAVYLHNQTCHRPTKLTSTVASSGTLEGNSEKSVNVSGISGINISVINHAPQPVTNGSERKKRRN